MSFQDFSQHFEDIYVCRFFDKDKWQTLYVIQTVSCVYRLASFVVYPFIELASVHVTCSQGADQAKLERG